MTTATQKKSHTPGPWRVHHCPQAGSISSPIWIFNPVTRSTVVDISACDVWPLSDEDRALIEAAPELYDRLRSLRDYLAVIRESKAVEGPTIDSFIAAATEVISKVE